LSGRDLRGRAFSGRAAEVGAFYAKNQDLTASFTGASFRIEDSDEWLPVTVTSRSLTLARGNALNGRSRRRRRPGSFPARSGWLIPTQGVSPRTVTKGRW
jgi:hypothetical protein